MFATRTTATSTFAASARVNLFNRDNQRYSLSDDGFLNSTGQFVPLDRNAGGRLYPAYYQQPTSFLKASSAYAPRLVQLGLRFVF
jgi:hypothetical protein